VRGSVYEWPASTSSALDMLLSEIQFASDQRSRMDTLIRSYAAQDSKTGLNNRLFFDNQLATLLEDQEKVGARHRDDDPPAGFRSAARQLGTAAAEEHYFTLINLLSTFIMRYPGALLARYHRSDFAVLLPHRTLKEADSIAGLLLKAVDALPPTQNSRSRRYDAYRDLRFPQRAIDSAGDGACGSGDAQRGAAGQQ
jgi:RNase E specificity factor CsrD